jgi:hypothetical protein
MLIQLSGLLPKKPAIERRQQTKEKKARECCLTNSDTSADCEYFGRQIDKAFLVLLLGSLSAADGFNTRR